MKDHRTIMKFNTFSIYQYNVARFIRILSFWKSLATSLSCLHFVANYSLWWTQIYFVASRKSSVY